MLLHAFIRELFAADFISWSTQHLSLQAWSGVRPIDPFALVKEELDSVSNRLRRTVLTEIPRLGQAAEYFFQLGAEGVL